MQLIVETIFEANSSMALNTSTLLYDHQHHPSPELFHLAKLKLYTHYNCDCSCDCCRCFLSSGKFWEILSPSASQAGVLLPGLPCCPHPHPHPTPACFLRSHRWCQPGPGGGLCWSAGGVWKPSDFVSSVSSFHVAEAMETPRAGHAGVS